MIRKPPKTSARARYLTPKELDTLEASLLELIQELEDGFGCLNTGIRALKTQDPNRANGIIERARKKLEETVTVLHNLR